MVRWNPGHEGRESHELVGPLRGYNLYGSRSSAGAAGGRSTGLTVGSLLGGSLLGAALMYLFDPAAGDRRRHRLAEAGEGAWDAAWDAARHGAEGVTGAAADAYDWAADHAATRARAATRAASGAWHWGRSRAADARDAAAGWRDDTAGHEDRGASIATVLASGLLCAACAAGLMFFLDPRSGRRRRVVARDKLGRYGRQAACAAREAGEHAYNHARGWAHEARQRAGDVLHGPEPVDDDTLVRRVRAQMGHHTRHAYSIRVSATDGHVMLAGPVPRAELEALAAFVRTIHGVKDAECRAESPDQPGRAPGPRGQA